MSTRARRTLALFAATALTAGSLVACAPQASTNKDSPKAEASATSQSSEIGIPKQTEEKPSESSSPAASSTTNSTTSSTQTEQPNATTTSTTSSEATPSQESITGWLIAACLDESSATSPAVTSVALSNDTLTVEGAMAYSESEPQGIPDDRNAWVSGPMTLTVDEHTKWQGRGGEAGTVSIAPDQLIQVVNSHNGLGLLIRVDNDVVSSITLAS